MMADDILDFVVVWGVEGIRGKGLSCLGYRLPTTDAGNLAHLKILR